MMSSCVGANSGARSYTFSELMGLDANDVEQGQLLPGEESRGTFAGKEQGEVILLAFEGTFNVPMVFTVTPEGGVAVTAELAGQELGADVQPSTEPFTVVATPQVDGESTLFLAGDGRKGSVGVTPAYLAGAPAVRKYQHGLILGKSQTGRLGAGAFDSFSFPGTENVPLRFSLIGNEELDLAYTVLKGDNELFTGTVGLDGSGLKEFAVTPYENGTYELRVAGVAGAGDYTLSSDYLSGSVMERAKPRVLAVGQTLEALKAPSAVEAYTFKGQKGQPVTLELRSLDGLQLSYELRDASGELISQTQPPIRFDPDFGKSYDITFTPLTAQPFELKVVEGLIMSTASGGQFGRYTLSAVTVEGVLNVPERQLELGMPRQGSLASGVTHDFSFAGAEPLPMFAAEDEVPTSVLIETSGELLVAYEVIDASGEVVRSEGDSSRHLIDLNSYAFDTLSEDHYQLRVTGGEGAGKYSVVLQQKEEESWF